jgi:hypothetical protein
MSVSALLLVERFGNMAQQWNYGFGGVNTSIARMHYKTTLRKSLGGDDDVSAPVRSCWAEAADSKLSQKNVRGSEFKIWVRNLDKSLHCQAPNCVQI